MRFSKEEKMKWLGDWRKSGKSAWGYAQANGLNPQTFSQWTKAGTQGKGSFVEVSAKKMRPVRQETEILIEKGEIKIHIPLSVWIQGFEVIMKGLRAGI